MGIKVKKSSSQFQSTSQFNIRLPDRLKSELNSFVQHGGSISSVAVQALEEWVRTSKFPGIDFRWTPTGRKPHVTGTGLSVWELYRMFKDHDEDVKKLIKNYPQLKPNQIGIATAYVKEYQDELPEGEFGSKPPFAQEVKA